jgi:hypothetical protein
LIILALTVLSGCGPSPEELQATTTQVAEELYGAPLEALLQIRKKDPLIVVGIIVGCPYGSVRHYELMDTLDCKCV